MVYRIALWLCTVTLTVSVGAVLLLPISIISNEVLLLYPTSYWIKWLNSSLIQGLWNLVFFFSNLALFILMPFAYFFTEAEGFSGSRKGLWARVKEASLVLFLLGLIVMGLFYIASTIISGDEKSKQTLQDVWYEHLPYLYSCISFFAVLALLMCTPVGVARMFTVMGRLIVKPQFLQDIEEELNTVRFEEENLMRKIKHRNGPAHLNNGHVTSVEELRENLKDIQKDRKALGITNFDLLGKFGSMDWLRKFYIIFLYNAVFVVSTALCLVQKFTSPVWRGIYTRLSVAFSRDERGSGASSQVGSGEGSGAAAAGSNGGVNNGSIGTKEDGCKEE
ncbi:protein LMBR1L [Elysia marginata]|uniref:Protein LMBR1L n=1 Tax=Elysia marginata TaxID=1093978 RepID=A0AAV4JHZ0_9GAST|nr:protein LMBR1L [Elysia marginata]